MRSRLASEDLRVLLARAAIVALALAAWQFLPQIGWLRERSAVFDPYFVSSPEAVAGRLWDLVTGSDPQGAVWTYLWSTLKAQVAGVFIGAAAGALMGLALSNSAIASRIMQPFITMMNATPRIALIPIFVIIFGPSMTSSILTAVLIVFFVVFYNAYAGGVSVPEHVLQSARLLGASKLEIMWHVRMRYVLVWAFAALPNAVNFGLLAVVTAEVLTGALGMGRLLQISIQTIDSTLTFSIVVVLTVVGLTTTMLADAIKRRVLFWEKSAAG